MGKKIDFNPNERFPYRHLTKEQQEIMRQSVEGTIISLAKIHCMNEATLPLDDLIQIGYLGFLNALQNFDRKKNVKFNSFCYTCVSHELHVALRKERRQKNRYISNTFIAEEENAQQLNELSLRAYEQQDGYREEDIWRLMELSELRSQLDKWINTDLFTDKERTLFQLRFQYGVEDLRPTQVECGEIMGVSQNAINHTEHSILKKMAVLLKKSGYDAYTR